MVQAPGVILKTVFFVADIADKLVTPQTGSKSRLELD
jgi:hypothetical protein